jgi:flagella synthesis protein FlgN
MNAEKVTPEMTLEVKPDFSLNAEYKLTEQLIEILKQEQAQLISADIEGLIAVTEEKSRAVMMMTDLTNRRYSALARAGYDAKEGGMRDWLAATSASPEINRAWQDLLTLAQSVKSLNSTNGLLISKHMARSQKALNVLQGNEAAVLYGPNGKSTNKITTRGLVVG